MRPASWDQPSQARTSDLPTKDGILLVIQKLPQVVQSVGDYCRGGAFRIGFNIAIDEVQAMHMSMKNAPTSLHIPTLKQQACRLRQFAAEIALAMGCMDEALSLFMEV